MKAFIISDKDYQTELFMQLRQVLYEYLDKRDFEIEHMQLGRKYLAFCIGCFGCWVRKPGECVINDAMSQINRTFINSDVVIYLCPVVFGQFSASIKNAIDRWLPNLLPFFQIKSDGFADHTSRYEAYPKQIMVGYGKDLSQNDLQLFIDITKKHRSNVEVLIFREGNTEITEGLNKINLKRESRQL